MLEKAEPHRSNILMQQRHADLRRNGTQSDARHCGEIFCFSSA
jgi:hypothetical protein